MSTKQCPYCHEEISADAILCKYCHNLLTEDDDDATVVFNPGEDDGERTRVFSAAEASRAARTDRDDRYEDEEYDNDDYDNDDDEYDEEYEDEDDDDDYDEGAAKKTFITAAVITFGILLIVIIAIFAGYKIFGGKSNDSSSAALNMSIAPQTVESGSDVSDPNAAPADASISESKGGDESTAPAPSESTSDESTPEESTPDESVSDDTSSEADTKPEDSSSQTDTPDSSSTAEADSSSEAADDSSSQAQADAPANTDDIIKKAADLIASHNDSGMKGFEYRATDSANTVMEYYYIYMNDGSPYSVAFNPNTGKYIIAGSGERFEG
ncbi:MAG: hypothetical protein IKO27_02795 [Ruminococcus sp.]|nr:hypothetical protein [Ruminococcus sp.]